MTGEFAVAVHALVYLDRRGEALDSAAIAQNVCTNPARVRKVMTKLRQAGLVEARTGAEGGYRLLAEARRISLRQIVDALEERPIASCWRSGDPSIDCMVASGMAGAMDRVYEELNRVCLDRLTAITLSDVEALLTPGAPCVSRK